MLKEDYQKLFDSISPDTVLGQRTEARIQKRLRRRETASLRRAVCIAVAALLLVGTAFAAVSASGILNRLFPTDAPPRQVAESVVTNVARATENGVTLSIDEVLFDHSTLHLGWTVSSERTRDVFYTTNYAFTYENPDDEALAKASIGGPLGSYSSDEIGDGTLVQLSRDVPSFSGYAGYAYSAPTASPVSVQLTVRAYETDWMPVSIPFDSTRDLFEVDGQIAALEAAGYLGITRRGQTSIQDYAAFQTALDALVASGMEWDAANEAALVECGVFREVAALELTVVAEPAKAAAPRFSLDGERRYELADATVILRRLEVCAVSTVVEYDVLTEKSPDAENAVGNGISYILFDQSGHPLNASYALGTAFVRLPGAEHAWRITHEGLPLPESVTAISFVPTISLRRSEGESSDAYFLRMRALAEPDQCFTVQLNPNER